MIEDLVTCPFCAQGVKDRRSASQPQVHYVDCPGCTRYSITWDALDELGVRPFSKLQGANASGWLREHPGAVVDEPELQTLRILLTLAPLDKAIKLFDLLCTVCPNAGEWYELRLGSPQLVSSAWAQSGQEVGYLISQVLVAELQFLELEELVSSGDHATIRITPRGWQTAEARRTPPAPPRPLGFR